MGRNKGDVYVSHTTQTPVLHRKPNHTMLSVVLHCCRCFHPAVELLRKTRNQYVYTMSVAYMQAVHSAPCLPGVDEPQKWVASVNRSPVFFAGWEGSGCYSPRIPPRCQLSASIFAALRVHLPRQIYGYRVKAKPCKWIDCIGAIFCLRYASAAPSEVTHLICKTFLCVVCLGPPMHSWSSRYSYFVFCNLPVNAAALVLPHFA